ncbi:MAG TPA: LysR family transcriptional regulator [Burkholderiaceae bacterium]|nr:LysR family transcriptional regulator [Burkholderiaceae bacterium]
MMDVDPKSLRLLVAVCDLRNMKQAAAQEHIEPSAISKRIAQLEHRLGAPLLVRGRRGVQPTPAGEAVLEHARTVLFTLERMKSNAAAFARGIRGQVRVVASPSAIAETLPDDLASFMREPAHREIRVDLEERSSREVVRAVRDGAASLGVAWDSVDFEGLEQRPYSSDELVLAVPVGHPLALSRRVNVAQMLAYDLVALPPGSAANAVLGRAAARAGGTLNYRVIVSNFDAALRVVAAGLAISVIPRPVVARARDKGIVMIGLAEPWATRRFALCFRELGALQPAAARLVEHLAARAHSRPLAARGKSVPSAGTRSRR